MKTRMKKSVLAIGTVLVVAAAICFGISILFHWVATSTMDGSTMLYGRLFRCRHVCAILGAVLLLTGIVLLAIGLTMKE